MLITISDTNKNYVIIKSEHVIGVISEQDEYYFMASTGKSYTCDRKSYEKILKLLVSAQI